MLNNYEIGMIVEGKVVQIKPFGAFIQLDEKTKGLVHISQVSHNYINDIKEVINEGDTVKVKIISIDEENNKISLSIKETVEKPAPAPKKENKKDYFEFKNNTEQTTPPSLEEMLKEFTRQSNDRFADLNKRQKRN